MIVLLATIAVLIARPAGRHAPSPRPAPPPSAAFTTHQGRGTVTLLDATPSKGRRLRYAWVVNGTRGPAGATARIEPTIGIHRIRLVVRDDRGRTSDSSREIAVAWRGTPFVAQKDNANAGHPFPTDPVGPWRVQSCINNGYSFRAKPDGVGAFTVHQGDHPGLTGGDRCAIELNEAYVPYINPNGQRPNEVRFYRVELGVPRSHPRTVGVWQTFAEWHGKAQGGSQLKIDVDDRNTTLRVSFAQLVRGVWRRPIELDPHPLAPGTWHDYVIEVKWSTDPSEGYVRVYRNGVCRTCRDPRADSAGRVYGATLKTFADGSSEPVAFSVQNYRGKSTASGAPIPSTTVLQRNTMIGPTLASVTQPR